MRLTPAFCAMRREGGWGDADRERSQNQSITSQRFRAAAIVNLSMPM
jgi:hypothetical protein